MQADITTDGRRILARIPYANGAGPRKAKEIAGAKWSKSDKVWTYPLTMTTCHAFRKVFGDQLRVAAPLSNWARTAIARGARLDDLRSGDASVARESLTAVAERAPALFAAISDRPYQMNGAAWIAEGAQVLLGDQPGLGKTIQTLAAIVQANARLILVACPRTAMRTVWARETNRWAGHIMPFVVQGSRREREQTITSFAVMPYDGPKMLIINTEMIRAKRIEVCPEHSDPSLCLAGPDGSQDHKHHYEPEYEWPALFDFVWDAIVLDESHNLLASTANVGSKRITQGRYGAVQLRKRLAKDGLAIALSGTPFRSKLEKSWGTLNWLRPDVFSSFWRFAEVHFGVTDDGWGKKVGTEVAEGKFVAEPLDLDAWDAELRPYYLARTKEVAAPDLPPIFYAGTPFDPDVPNGENYVWLDMETKQARAYAQMQKMAMAQIDNGTVTATGVLAEITRLRQFAGAYGRIDDELEFFPEPPSNKLDWLIEFMLERQGNGGKVVVASGFTKMVNLAAKMLEEWGFQVGTLTGATSDDERAELVRRFNDPDDPIQVAVINSRAGGEAITLDLADDMVFLDLPWTSDQAAQVEARIHRVSRIHNVTVYRLLSRGTVDEWMATLNEDQKRILISARPRALELVKELLHS